MATNKNLLTESMFPIKGEGFFYLIFIGLKNEDFYLGSPVCGSLREQKKKGRRGQSRLADHDLSLIQADVFRFHLLAPISKKSQSKATEFFVSGIPVKNFTHKTDFGQI